VERWTLPGRYSPTDRKQNFCFRDTDWATQTILRRHDVLIPTRDAVADTVKVEVTASVDKRTGDSTA